MFGNARMRGQQFAQGYGLQYFETSAVRPESSCPWQRQNAQTSRLLVCLTSSLHACMRVQMNTEGVNETFDSIAKEFAQSYVEYTRRLGA